MGDDDRYNTEHYRDSTASAALRHIEADDLERVKFAICAMKGAAKIFGFSVGERIVLIDLKSGRTYR